MVGAVSDEAKLKFLNALEKSSSFTHVVLVNEKHSTPSPGSVDRVDLELTVIYSRT